jgi:hypothetical protein
MTSDERILAQQRMLRVSNYLHALVPSDPKVVLTERTHRLLWLYGFHLGAMVRLMDQALWYRKVHRWVEWLEYVNRFDDTAVDSVRRRIQAAVRRLPRSDEGRSEAVDTWWATHVLIANGEATEDFRALNHSGDVQISRVRSDPQEIVRTARILRPHLIILGPQELGNRLAALLHTLRDDQRLSGSSIWIDGRKGTGLDPDLASLVDGRLDSPGGNDLSNLRSALAGVRRMRDLAVFDPSTGTASLAYLRQILASECVRCGRKKEKFSLMALTWNPQLWTDPKWDKPLTSHLRSSQVADYLQRILRRSDVVASDGAGRLYVLAFDATPSYLSRRLEEISEYLSNQLDDIVPQSYPLLLMGRAVYPDAGRVPEDLMAHAHEMLWQGLQSDLRPGCSLASSRNR